MSLTHYSENKCNQPDRFDIAFQNDALSFDNSCGIYIHGTKHGGPGTWWLLFRVRRHRREKASQLTNIGPNIEVHTPKMNTDTRAINPNNDKNRYAIN